MSNSQDINIVIVEVNNDMHVAAFTSPKQAIDWFKKFFAEDAKVSIHAVEINSIEPMVYAESEL